MRSSHSSLIESVLDHDSSLPCVRDFKFVQPRRIYCQLASLTPVVIPTALEPHVLGMKRCRIQLGVAL